MKTSELTGLALDWAVAKCEGEKAELNQGEIVTWKTIAFREYRLIWNPSTNWVQGGPIIERERINLWNEGYDWEASLFGEHIVWGPTPLIAAMRCYVASKLGDDIDVPAELIGA